MTNVVMDNLDEVIIIKNEKGIQGQKRRGRKAEVLMNRLLFFFDLFISK